MARINATHRDCGCAVCAQRPRTNLALGSACRGTRDAGVRNCLLDGVLAPLHRSLVRLMCWPVWRVWQFAVAGSCRIFAAWWYRYEILQSDTGDAAALECESDRLRLWRSELSLSGYLGISQLVAPHPAKGAGGSGDLTANPSSAVGRKVMGSERMIET